jgi:hypothetical protein
VSDWPEPTLADVDSDGAVTEALARLHGETRAGFLRRAVIGSGALLAACATPAAAATGPDDHDVTILNFALALEYLQAAFYTEVDQLGHLSGPLAQQARVVGAHERAHVRAFRDVLGDRAIRRPRYDFRGATESGQRFAKTAVAFEDLSVAAYKGQAPRIHAVEARHAAWIRRLAGVSPVLSAFDEPISMPRTLRVVNATHFAMTTGSRRSPRFTG